MKIDFKYTPEEIGRTCQLFINDEPLASIQMPFDHIILYDKNMAIALYNEEALYDLIITQWFETTHLELAYYGRKK